MNNIYDRKKQVIEESIQKIESRYNGDHDLPSDDQPLVTWTDYELLCIIKDLSRHIDELEQRFQDHDLKPYSLGDGW